MARRLQYDDPFSVTTCTHILESPLDQADICSAILYLENNTTVPLTATAMEAYEEFDKIITRIMLQAKKNAGNCLWEEYRSHLTWHTTSI